jgi:tripartite-type tricarboxylate transporter receptor subunit TctC
VGAVAQDCAGEAVIAPMQRIAASIVALFVIVVSATGARADPIADFYRGKTLRLLIGYGPGGGYDLYARLVAEFLPRHLPGNPSIVPENMPGAGSFVAAKYMADVAPKDGTVLGSLAQTLALDSAVGGPAKVNAANFHYIGRITTNIDSGVALPASGIKSFDDVRAKQYTVGASGGGSTTVLYPLALNAFAGAKFKIVRGYKGTTDILLAMERGEVDVTGAYGLPGMLVSHPGWIDRGEAAILYQAALKRHRLLPNVPTLPELATSDEGRAILHAIAGTAEIGRSIIVGPGIPDERLAALRAAFSDMLKDADFLAACDQRHVMVDPGTGEEMDAITRETFALSADVLAKTGAMLNAN